VINLDALYFEWLLTCLDPEGALEGVAYVGDLLHNCEFERRVGNDINRAIDGTELRKEFIAQYSEADIDPWLTNELMMTECSWFEMLVALCRHLDFTYDGGVEERFIELITNLTLDPMLQHGPSRSAHMREYDQRFVDVATHNVDTNNFDKNGHGGLFPLTRPGYPDQRRVEIWDQCGAYFHERLEGVLF
jgi:hypothetical protein